MSVLGVPVDHRLRDIIRKLISQNISSSNVPNDRGGVNHPRSRGWLISENEVDFACYLAQPAVQGGIVVALTQPPQHQDYSTTTDDTVKGCNTLLALQQLGEFFNLPFDRLSIFDAFPFITEKEHDQEDVDHSESHTTFHEMILEKRPTVILSGWTSPSFAGFTTKPLQKRPIGAVFRSPIVHYFGLKFSMVNMPHPSYCVNYNPTESCFRQLQILEFAQACGRLWGTWQEKAWMADLRRRCRARAKFLFDNRCDSSDEAFITERLTQTLTQLGPLLSTICYNFSSKAQIEDLLSKTNILELCSDASLILRRVDAITDDTKGLECVEASLAFICSWYDSRWPAFGDFLLPVSAGIQGLYDPSCFDRIPVVDSPPLSRQIESCLMDFAKEMNLTWTLDAFKPDFEAQASAFFHLTKGIEDAMDKFPDNNRVFSKTQDELDIVDTNVQIPTCVNNQKIELEPIDTNRDVASDSLMERLRGLGI